MRHVGSHGNEAKWGQGVTMSSSSLLPGRRPLKGPSSRFFLTFVTAMLHMLGGHGNEARWGQRGKVVAMSSPREGDHSKGRRQVFLTFVTTMPHTHVRGPWQWGEVRAEGEGGGHELFVSPPQKGTTQRVVKFFFFYLWLRRPASGEGGWVDEVSLGGARVTELILDQENHTWLGPKVGKITYKSH